MATYALLKRGGGSVPFQAHSPEELMEEITRHYGTGMKVTGLDEPICGARRRAYVVHAWNTDALDLALAIVEAQDVSG